MFDLKSYLNEKRCIIDAELDSKIPDENTPPRILHKAMRYSVFPGGTRLRPILMTMLTTVLGLIPMALGIGSASEMRAPMARTVIGGLLVSTIFTLVLIPTLYTIFEMRKEKRGMKRLARVGGVENNE